MNHRPLVGRLLELVRDDTLTRQEYKRQVLMLLNEIKAFAQDEALPPVARALPLRAVLGRLRETRGLPAREGGANPAADLAEIETALARRGRGRPMIGLVVVKTRVPDDLVTWMDEEVLRRGISVTADETGRPELIRQVLHEIRAAQQARADRRAEVRACALPLMRKMAATWALAGHGLHAYDRDELIETVHRRLIGKTPTPISVDEAAVLVDDLLAGPPMLVDEAAAVLSPTEAS